MCSYRPSEAGGAPGPVRLDAYPTPVRGTAGSMEFFGGRSLFAFYNERTGEYEVRARIPLFDDISRMMYKKRYTVPIPTGHGRLPFSGWLHPTISC